MTLKEIAVKNLLRRKGKTAFVLAGLVIGVATVVAVVDLAERMTGDINGKLEKYGANILVLPQTDNLDLSYGGLSLGGVSLEDREIRQTDVEAIRNIKNAGNIAALGPMVFGGIHIDSKRVPLAGIDFSTTGVLKPWWKVDGHFPTEPDSILAGSQAASVLGLKSGDTFRFEARDLRISGVLEPTGSQDDRILFAPLETAQQLLGKHGMLSLVEIAALCNACPIDDMVSQISNALPGTEVTAIQQVVKSRMETIMHFKKLSYGVSAVVIFIGGLVVLVTLMGSVRERTEEIGIFRAVGFRRSHVMRIVFIEAALSSALAGLFGYLLGMLGVHLGLLLFSTKPPAFAWNWPLAGGAFAMALFVGLAAAAYPANIASRLDPNTALRSL